MSEEAAISSQPLYLIKGSARFTKSVKALFKKYPSILNDIDGLKTVLQANPQSGTSLGRDCYKIRMAISSKRAGKSGGARVITYVRLSASSIAFLDIFDKSEKESITEQELDALLKAYLAE